MICQRAGCQSEAGWDMQGHGLNMELCRACFVEAGWVAWMLTAVLGMLR